MFHFDIGEHRVCYCYLIKNALVLSKSNGMILMGIFITCCKSIIELYLQNQKQEGRKS